MTEKVACYMIISEFVFIYDLLTYYEIQVCLSHLLANIAK